MKKNVMFVLVLAVFCWSVQAANIIYVPKARDGSVHAGVAAVLEGAGHTVTGFTGGVTPSEAELAVLEAADLIIFGIDNGSKQDGDASVWNGISKPLLAMAAYTIDDWGWTGAGLIDTYTTLTVVDDSDLVWDGLDVTNGDMVTLFNSVGVRTCEPVSNGGVVIASLAGNNADIAIARWAGNTLALGGGERLFFAAYTQGNAMNVTALGEQVFLNAVTSLLPDPMAPSPANKEQISLPFGDGTTGDEVKLSWTNKDPNTVVDPTNVTYVDVYYGTDSGSLTKIVSGQPVSEAIVTASVGLNYWRVDSYLSGNPAEVDYTLDSEPNVVVGRLFSFEAKNDLAPAVTIDTTDKRTWPGEPVPLAATITDDGQSPVTILWTASPLTSTDPNYLVTIEDADTATPTVIVDKSYGVARPIVNLTVSVSDEANPTPVTDTMMIKVYHSECDMIRVGLDLYLISDANGDCVVDLVDLSLLASEWLADIRVGGPIDYNL